MKVTLRSILITAALAWVSCPAAGPSEAGAAARGADSAAAATAAAARNRATATFAGGCFWCMEPPFEILPGVVAVTVGYTGGKRQNPTYEEVSSGTTGHVEAIQVAYDSTRISYARLLDVFWRNIDPLTPDRQFCDAGSQYRAVIFYHNPEQRRLAEASKNAWGRSGRFDRPVVTEILPASTFYAAEEYHQDFHKKDPVRYNSYRTVCGRDKRLKQIWGGARPAH